MTVTVALLTILAGALPATAAWVGKLIVDGVVEAALTRAEAERAQLYWLIGLEALMLLAVLGAERGLAACRGLLGIKLGDSVRVLILEKAMELELGHFENPDIHDHITRARRDAASRPISLLNRHFAVIKDLIALVAFGVVLFQLSPWAILLVLGAGLPAFLAEVRFSRKAFQLARRRSHAKRERAYIENVLARDDFAKEVKVLGLAPRFMAQFMELTRSLYRDERQIATRRGLWGIVLGSIGTVVFYGAYVWVVLATVNGTLSIGEMTMYLVVFRQAQATVTTALTTLGGMYEDHLFLEDLQALLGLQIAKPTGSAHAGPNPDDGLRFEEVSFSYPDADQPALDRVSFHLRPGQILALVGANGSGKTTVIKLLTRLYEVDGGRITLDGLDVRAWDVEQLRRRVGVIFQDFVRYKLSAGENIGLGDVDHVDDEARLDQASGLGMASSVIAGLPEGYRSRLGRWFSGGHELSGGQWQKIALSRAFMRRDADVLVLDEPTASIDADAESQVFEHVRSITDRQMVILISHRFSTVRLADEIVVLDHGRVLEDGSHAELMAMGGRYARLFRLQAAAYH